MDLDEIEKACERARAYSDLRFTAPWVLEAVPALVARVRELEADLSRRNDALATLTRLDEREACAEVAEIESRRQLSADWENCADTIAAAIRARKP